MKAGPESHIQCLQSTHELYPIPHVHIEGQNTPTVLKAQNRSPSLSIPSEIKSPSLELTQRESSLKTGIHCPGVGKCILPGQGVR